MPSVSTKKKSRFRLEETKAVTEEQVDKLMTAYQAKSNEEESIALPKPKTIELPKKAELPVENPGRNLQTTPRIREQLPMAATFAQKASVQHIERFNALAEKRLMNRQAPWVKRDLLEEALEYICQKYE